MSEQGAPARLRHRPRVYNIQAGVPFLDALAKGIWDDAAGDLVALAQARVLLPNRRACRNLRDAFLRLTDGRPLLLPRLQPVGDIDDDEFVLTAGEGEAEFDLPPAISPLERHLLLTRLVLKRPDVAANPVVAARLADALAALLDSAQIDEVTLDRLDALVPADLAQHWQVTLDFLQIIRQHWPAILAERGQIDPVDRQIRLIRGLAARWGAAPPDVRVYAAGSTGSIPATAELLAIVARLPEGKLILPGLDLAMDETCWEEVAAEPSHPQYGLCRLLDSIGVKRDEVRPWPHRPDGPGREARVRLLGEALRPATTTDRWLDLASSSEEACVGLQRIEAATPQEEAGAIALIMRETLESAGKTAALVTPDRELARRVVAELARWNVTVDDSAGIRLAQTTPGIFLRLVARTIADGAAPASLLALLKHPLACGGLARGDFLRRARYLERRILRGPRPAPGFKGLAHAIAASKYAADLSDWVEGLAMAAAPLERLMAATDVPLDELLVAHVRFAEFLSTPSGETNALIWQGEAGEALANFVGELRLSAALLDRVDGNAWPGLLDALMAARAVRPHYGRHPRLFIWGPLEARLQHADVLILGGLNEGTWPPEPQEDPWLSRPMRAALGLSPIERRIGLSAHDFVQAASASCVVLSRASKVEGAPSVPSRWLLRLNAMLAHDEAWAKTLNGGAADWHRRLDEPASVSPVKPPRPCPPVAARPRKLSITEIETWIRDPYAIYARHVLGLRPLDPLDADPGALERGLMIHKALEMFVREHMGHLPDDALARLIACGEAAFKPFIDQPSVRAFWWPRFCRVAAWFVEFERARRAEGTRPRAVECLGELRLDGPGGAFVLRGKADRLDTLPGEALAILDYKTGQPPSSRQVASGLSPQLPLEAAIALAGGFGTAAKEIGELAYIRLSGGTLAGSYRPIQHDRDGVELTPGVLAAEARAGLVRRILQFDRPSTPYLSRPRPQWLSRDGDYDHLARVKEWAMAGRREP